MEPYIKSFWKSSNTQGVNCFVIQSKREVILLSSVFPLFKLLKTPRKKYFYDVGKNEIIMISNRLFNDLRMVENGELS